MEIKKAEVGVPLRRAFFPEIRSINEKARTIEFVASDESVDRYGDVIRVAGWKYQNYLKNPVFLWGHRSGDPPIGKCVDLKVESKPPALVQTIEFAPKDVYPFAETVFRLYKGGFMRAVSVGFMATEQPMPMKDEEGRMTGYEFNGQELLELSAVPIPANQNALARAMNTGNITEEEIKKFFSFGEKNPAWAYLAPGVTVPEKESKEKKENEVKPEDEKKIAGRQEPAEPPEDEPAGSAADNAEELGEALDEIAAAVAEAQKLSAVLVSQLEPGASEENDSARPAVSKQRAVDGGTLSGVLARVVETRGRLDNLAGAVARQSDLTDATLRINELRGMVEKQVETLTKIAETGVTKEEFSEVVMRFEEIRGQFSKLLAAVAKESLQVDIVTRVEEIRTRVDKIAANAVKKSDLTNVEAKIDAQRGIIDNLSEVAARKVEVVDAITRISEVANRVESFSNVGAKESSLTAIRTGQDEIRAQVDNLTETSARESTLADIRAEQSEIRTRLDTLSTTTVTRPFIEEQIAKIGELSAKIAALTAAFSEFVASFRQQPVAEEKTVVPYVDDPIAPKDTPWDASAELAKQTTPAGWKRMSTVIVGDPKLKGSYKLAHHSGSGFKVIPNGVRAALGRFEQTQMDSADRSEARSHLVKHQKKISAQSGIEFDDAAFELKLAQLGEAYRAAEAANLIGLTESVSREIEAHLAILDPAPKPEKISTTEDLFAKLVSKQSK